MGWYLWNLTNFSWGNICVNYILVHSTHGRLIFAFLKLFRNISIPPTHSPKSPLLFSYVTCNLWPTHPPLKYDDIIYGRPLLAAEAKGTSSSQQPLLAEVSKNELYLISWKCIRFTPFYLFSHRSYSRK